MLFVKKKKKKKLLITKKKTLDSSALKPCRSTTHARKIILHRAAFPGFQTEMATKRPNLRTAALKTKNTNLRLQD